MKIHPITSINPYYSISQDIMVNSIGAVRFNKSYRDVNNPVHVPIVEPAVKIQISAEARKYLEQN
jgi:hypothetical protein